MFLLVAFLLLFLLDSPWNLLAFVACLVIFVGEVLLWYRTVQSRRAAVGADTLIGAEGDVVTPCRPDGQVRLDAEIWAARCEAGADAGQRVRVVGRNGLTLIVEPV